MSAVVVAPEIVAGINEAHRACHAAAGEALRHALRAGELLTRAKAALKHGGWTEWLRENTEIPQRTAQRYMQIARDWPKITEANAPRVADLSVRGALTAITDVTSRVAALPAADQVRVVDKLGTRGAIRRQDIARAARDYRREYYIEPEPASGAWVSVTYGRTVTVEPWAPHLPGRIAALQQQIDTLGQEQNAVIAEYEAKTAALQGTILDLMDERHGLERILRPRAYFRPAGTGDEVLPVLTDDDVDVLMALRWIDGCVPSLDVEHRGESLDLLDWWSDPVDDDLSVWVVTYEDGAGSGWSRQFWWDGPTDLRNGAA